MQTNRKEDSGPLTHEGARAARISPSMELRRTVLSCLLWEDGFYETGQDIGARIADLCKQVSPWPWVISDLAIEARNEHNLRHVSLLLLDQLTKYAPDRVRFTASWVLKRADEPGEWLALHRKDRRATVTRQMRLALQDALFRFGEYQFGKYNSRKAKYKLRDVLRIARPRPRNEEQKELFRKIVKGELAIPDTWETALSAGADKKETFTRLLREDKLGYFALLRNLRNMQEAGVDPALVEAAIVARRNGADKVLPFRYVAAYNHAPQYRPAIDYAFTASRVTLPLFDGETVVLVDVSGSMCSPLSAKSFMSRIDAAAALACLVRPKGSNLARVFTFSNELVEVTNVVPSLSAIEAIRRSQHNASTYLGKAVKYLNEYVNHDRLIVITDEQSADPVPAPRARNAYMINVAPYQNGVGYANGWTHIDGFSENVIKYIHEFERISECGEQD